MSEPADWGDFEWLLHADILEERGDIGDALLIRDDVAGESPWNWEYRWLGGAAGVGSGVGSVGDVVGVGGDGGVGVGSGDGGVGGGVVGVGGGGGE